MTISCNTMHRCIARATQSSCCSAKFTTFFRLSYVTPNSPALNSIDCEIYRELHTAATVYELHASKRSRLKKSSNDWLKSGIAVIQRLSEKMQFPCFARYIYRHYSLVRWEKPVMIAYFLNNNSAKNHQNRCTSYDKVIHR